MDTACCEAIGRSHSSWSPRLAGLYHHTTEHFNMEAGWREYTLVTWSIL